MKNAIIWSVLAIAGGLYGENNHANKKNGKKEAPPQTENILLPQGWVSEEVLLWKTSADRFAYGNRAEPLGSASYLNQSLNEPHAQWNAGVRLTGGYRREDWSFFGTWTYVQNKAGGHKSTSGTKGFFPVLSMAPGLNQQNYITAASEEWRLNFHCIDLGAIYSWRPDFALQLKPHAALRLAFLDQRAITNYAGGLFSGGMDRLVLKNDFWGVGPAAGLTTAIHFTAGFSLVGDVAGSLLGGRLFTKESESYLNQTLVSNREFDVRFGWSLDAKLGLNWETKPFYQILTMSLQLGWEWHTFYGQTRLPQNGFGFFDSPQNVGMQGAYFSAALGF